MEYAGRGLKFEKKRRENGDFFLKISTSKRTIG
jgi:hypothetical protein